MSERSSKLIHEMNPEMFSKSATVRAIIWTSLSLVLIISLLDITGWILNLSLLRSIGPDWEDMRIVTALCFIISAVALILIMLDRRPRWMKALVSFAFTAIGFICLTSLYVYLYSIILSHESSLIRLPFFMLFLSPDNRMAFLTTFSFLSVGYILYLLRTRPPSSCGISNIILIPVFLISYFTIITYILGVSDATEIEHLPVALNTAIAFTALGIAIIHMSPRTSLIKLYNLRLTGGIVSRRLLPPVIILPIIIGWMRIQGERAGLFASEQGVIIVAITYTFCFIFLVWLTARYINKIDLQREASEKTLRESEERFRTLADNVPDMITRFDTNLRLIYSNPAVGIKTGLNDEAMRGFSANEYGASPSAVINWESAAREVLRTGKAVRIEHVNNWQNKKRVFDVHLVPEFNPGGEVASILGISRDITERKIIEETLLESREQLSAIFNSVSETLMLLDLEGNIIAANETAKRRFNKDETGIRGKSIYDLIPEEFHKYRKELTSKIISTKQPVKFEDKLGNTILDLTMYPVINSDNDVIQMVSFAEDITLKKKAEESLLFQSKMLEAVNDAIIGTDLNYRISYWNRGAERIYGWKPEEVAGKFVQDVLRSEISGEALEAIIRNLNEGHPAVTELVQYTKENRKRIVEGYTIPLIDSAGTIVSFVAINRDITEHKEADDAMRESETKFNSIFHLSPVAMVLSSLDDGKYRDVNDVFLKDTGYLREEVIGRTSDDLNIFSDREERSRIVNQVKMDGLIYGVPCDFRLKNGNTLPCLVSINIISINESRFMLSTIQDVSEISKTREELRQSEERFKAIAAVSPVGMSVVDKQEGNFLYMNPAYEEHLGYEKDELLGKKAPEIYWDPSDRAKMLEILRENNYVSNFEVRLRRKDGSSFWSMLSVRQINFINKPALLGTFIDITKRKQAEDLLRNSEQRLKFHIENSPLGVIEWGHDFIVTKWSGEAERIFGWSKAEVLGLRIDELKMIFEEDIPIVESTMKRLTGGRELQVVSENRNYTKIREIRNCIWYNSVLLDETGQMSSVMSLVEDVTETRKVEGLLKESEGKLLSVLNASQESIFMFDRKGVITMSNSKGMERLKIRPGMELIGHSLSEFIPAAVAAGRQKKLQEVFDSGSPLEFEDVLDDRMISHNYFPVVKDGKVSFVVSYSTDITERKRAEENLKESEDRFRTIAESLPVLIAIYNIEDSALSFVNKTFERAFGFEEGELLNNRLPDSFFDHEEITDLANLLKEKGRAYNRELRVKKTDGSSFWIMASIRRILFMNQPSYLTASINITESKKAQEDLMQVNRTLDARSKSSHAMMHSRDEFSYLNEVCKIIIEDCGHSMVWVGYAQNDEAKSVKPVAYYGFDKGYVESMNITWDDNERGRGPTGTAIRLGKPTVCKNMLTDPTFKPWRKAALERGYLSSLTLPLILEGKPFGSISIYSREPDPFSENEINLLSNLADDLAYGISFLRLEESERSSAKLIRENEAKLKELIATKDKFFNIVAHDLKNPFTSLIGSSELLFENLEQLNSKSIRELAMILNDSAKSGYAILQNLLDWSRSQTGMLRINPEKVNLKNLINENLSSLQLPAANKEIILINEANQDIFVVADKNMINTILRNILSNALKFSYKSGRIIISSIKKSEEVIISVKDHGIGISENKLDTLFRLDVKNSIPGTENEQGTGLGLKLSQEFVEKLGGKIWVESSEKKGSTFSISIPLKWELS